MKCGMNSIGGVLEEKPDPGLDDLESVLIRIRNSSEERTMWDPEEKNERRRPSPDIRNKPPETPPRVLSESEILKFYLLESPDVRKAHGLIKDPHTMKLQIGDLERFVSLLPELQLELERILLGQW